MGTGTIVYLSWYDFSMKTENVCKGEVVDNSPWDGTKWQGYVNVLFQPPHSAGPFCHHFPEDKLSLTPDNVPHDDCYLVCGKKTRSYEHDYTVKATVPDGSPSAASPSDAWQQVQQFKQDRWDYQRGHLDTDALDEYYSLWRNAIAAKRGLPVTVPAASPANSTPTLPHPVPGTSASVPDKLTRKQKLSTGSIQYKDSIQTSIFD